MLFFNTRLVQSDEAVKFVNVALRAVATRLVIADENIDVQRTGDKERVERVEVGQRVHAG